MTQFVPEAIGRFLSPFDKQLGVEVLAGGSGRERPPAFGQVGGSNGEHSRTRLLGQLD